VYAKDNAVEEPLVKFLSSAAWNGIPKNKFNLFLKECEFRFNYGTPKQLLATLKK
jgi:transposase-like protein